MSSYSNLSRAQAGARQTSANNGRFPRQGNGAENLGYDEEDDQVSQMGRRTPINNRGNDGRQMNGSANSDYDEEDDQVSQTNNGSQNSWTSGNDKLTDPQEYLLSLLPNLPHLTDAYIEYTQDPTKNVLLFGNVTQVLRIMLRNLQLIENNTAYQQFNNIYNSFAENSLSDQLDIISNLVSIYNSAINEYNQEQANGRSLNTLNNTDTRSLQKMACSAYFDTIVSNLQDIKQNVEDAAISAIDNYIARIQQSKKNFQTGLNMRNFTEALSVFNRVISSLGYQNSVKQEVQQLSTPQFKMDLQQALSKLTSSNRRSAVRAISNRPAQSRSRPARLQGSVQSNASHSTQ